MKIIGLFLFFLMAFSVYSNGRREIPLVNEQNMQLENAISLEIDYRSEEVVLFINSTNSIIVREYMSENNIDYYANITHTGNTLSIKRGDRPVSLGLFGSFFARVEVYLPEHFIQNIDITTASGRIILPENITISQVKLQSSSGSISGGSITGDIIAKASSGSISFGIISGNASIESMSGRITVEKLSGSLIAKASSGSINAGMITGNAILVTSSGRIQSSFDRIIGDISLTSRSGRIDLKIPQNSEFNFSARRTSGNLSTPFSEKLFSPVSDRRLAEGIIGDNNPSNNISIGTTSGSISVQWNN
ncbi:MAG: DUF4097 domain-containing protein [Treponema sp.]|nr:DUF4097 domain-containing protein [Treponema sp.]